MDEIIDFKNFEVLNSCLKDSEIIKTIKLLVVFGITGCEVIYITNDDKVYCFGPNRNGCLGLANYDQLKEPQLNPQLSGKGLVDIVCGLHHCIGLFSDGKCYAWGLNEYGRLGIGTYHDSPTPKLITELANEFVIRIACGNSHTLALTDKGQVYTWGRNNWGQLGIKHNRSRSFPNRVEIQQKVVEISCGRNHSVALTDLNLIYVWGVNDSGQLGHRNTTKYRGNSDKPSSSKPHILSNFNKYNDIAKVVCGPNHCLVLTTCGSLYGFGDNNYGQVGNNKFRQMFSPNRLDNGCKFKDIIANNQNDLSMAVTEDNKCYVWGPTDPKLMTTLNARPLIPKLSVFDIYAKLIRFKITFKTVVINEDNKQLNAIKCEEVLKPNTKSGANLSHLNSLLKKNFDSNQIHPNLRPESTPTKTKISENGTNDKNNNHSNEIQDSGKDTDVEDLETKSIQSIDSDDYHSCFGPLLNGKAVQKFLKYLTHSFDKQDFADLRFIFNDGRAVYCHKTILKIRNRMFWYKCCQYLVKCSGNHTLLKEELNVENYSYEPFHAFLQYLYGFEPDIDSHMIEVLLKLAHIYEEPELSDLCYKFMDEKTDDSLNILNVCTLYEKSIKNSLTDLEKFCIEFTAKNWKNICKSDAFQALNDSICERLMSEVFGPKK